jgi:hypothetical protein
LRRADFFGFAFARYRPPVEISEEIKKKVFEGVEPEVMRPLLAQETKLGKVIIERYLGDESAGSQDSAN